MSSLSIYDSVRMSDDNGGMSGLVMKLVETTVKSAMPDMKDISEETMTKVTVLVMPDMVLKTVMSDKVEKN